MMRGKVVDETKNTLAIEHAGEGGHGPQARQRVPVHIRGRKDHRVMDQRFSTDQKIESRRLGDLMNSEVKDIGIDVKAPRPPATTSTARSTGSLPVQGPDHRRGGRFRQDEQDRSGGEELSEV